MKSLVTSAPANTMLMGEHSVVYGQAALLAALPPRIRIFWQARTDNQIRIESSLAVYQSPINDLQDHPNLRFVLAPLQQLSDQLNSGWTLKIESDFPSDWGLGSSAAVLAATLVGLETLLELKWDHWARFSFGHSCILSVQGRGSGADLAASLHGGLVYFDPQHQQITRLDQPMDLCLAYSGYKTPTPQVLAWVAQHWQSKPEQLQRLYQQMGKLTQQAYEALQQSNWPHFYEQVKAYQQAMQQLGVCDPCLSQIVRQLEAQLPAAKISGSGLGDCVLGFGHIDSLGEYPILNTQISARGADCQP